MNICDLLSREQAAAELGLSLGALRHLSDNGRLPLLRINGKCVRVLRSDLEHLKRELTELHTSSSPVEVRP